jgi:acetyl-CoA hydrolase
MDWNKLYQSRIVTAEEAAQQIKPGNRVFLTGNCSVPQTILASLVDYAPELYDVEINQALTVGPADYVSPNMDGHLRVKTLHLYYYPSLPCYLRMDIYH